MLLVDQRLAYAERWHKRHNPPNRLSAEPGRWAGSLSSDEGLLSGKLVL